MARKMSDRFCIVCGKKIKGRGKQFCGRDCYIIDLNRRPKKQDIIIDNKKVTNYEVTRYCLYCNRDIKVNIKDLADPKSLYCDAFCRSKFTSYNDKHFTYVTSYCNRCGKEFVTVDGITDRCCLECTDDIIIEHREIYQGICAECSKDFSSDDISTIYCSDKCFYMSRRQGVVKKQCEYCGSIMHVTKDVISMGKCFCGTKCYDKFMEVALWPDNVRLKAYLLEPREMVCLSCNTPFYTFKEGVKHCCLNCYTENPFNYHPPDWSFSFNAMTDDLKKKAIKFKFC